MKKNVEPIIKSVCWVSSVETNPEFLILLYSLGEKKKKKRRGVEFWPEPVFPVLCLIKSYKIVRDFTTQTNMDRFGLLYTEADRT